ncbi:MAG: cytochrome c biogenesis heme-transporting ATPase CcmA [Casimicrobiaceae bacterium]
MLEAQQLAAQRGSAVLFANVDFSLRAGEALLITGANGSGKTTLMKIVAGMTRSAAGRLVWQGTVVVPFDAALRASALYVGHASALNDELTAEENLVALLRLHGAAADGAAIRAALGAWSLDAQRQLPARALSQGQRRRVSLARLRLQRREVWILDEPTSALDADGVALLEQHISTHLAGGGIALIATHHDLALTSGAQRKLHLQ